MGLAGRAGLGQAGPCLTASPRPDIDSFVAGVEAMAAQPGVALVAETSHEAPQVTGVVLTVSASDFRANAIALSQEVRRVSAIEAL